MSSKVSNHAVKLVFMISVAILTEHKCSAAAVTLISTLKQNSLCPGDGAATFTCTCRGMDLTWIVGGRMMSYNANSKMGAVRSNAESDETAILLAVESIGENGLANRMSVLTIRERLHSTEPITVQCHNGSASQTQTKTFWRKVADNLQAPELNEPEVQEKRLTLNWTQPDTPMQDVAFYAIQVDEAPPMMVKNTTTTLFIPDIGTQNISIGITAVDMCSQTGLKRTYEVQPSPTTATTDPVTTNPVTTDPVTSASPTTSKIILSAVNDVFSSASRITDITMSFLSTLVLLGHCVSM